MTSMLGDAFGDQILIPISKSSERRAEREREGCINRICLLIRFSHIVPSAAPQGDVLSSFFWVCCHWMQCGCQLGPSVEEPSDPAVLGTGQLRQDVFPC